MSLSKHLALATAFAAGSLALSLLLFGGSRAALSGAASSAASNGPDLTALPLGDGKTSTSGTGKGMLYVCRESNPNAPGAQVDGPWIHGSSYDATAKYVVDGSNRWANARFKTKVKKAVLKLIGNGLPTNHGTGNYPISPGDDAYTVDRNPNSVSAQSVIEKLSRRPTKAKRPACVPEGVVGIARNGVAIFSAVDGAGRDAVAHEVQDSCSGHPQQSGQYHYHGLPACVGTGSDKRHSKLLGWMLDGFPIYGPIGDDGRYMRTSDLDACHGHSHKISYQGRKAKLYHYHATDEYPYTVGCLRGGSVGG